MPGHFKRGVTRATKAIKDEPVGEYLGVHMLGSLRDANGDPLLRPTAPWRNSFSFTCGEHTSETRGNIRSLTIDPLSFDDTPKEDRFRLKWHVFADRGKYLYICDRNILVGVTTETLAERGWVHGAPAVIDGDNYMVRSLTMGVRPIDGLYGGAFPEDNEWDRYVLNKAGFEGAPTPTEDDMGTTDLSSNAAAMARPHNQSWWWCSVSTAGGPVWRGLSRWEPRAWVGRGGNTAQYVDRVQVGFYNVSFSNSGFRPVLVRAA